MLAALRENMLRLAAERCAGAHPYNVTPEHTARARAILGSGPTLAPEQMVLRETDPSKARAIARKNLAIYLSLPNYMNGWRWLGFGDDDFTNGGSDRLIDAVVAWGDEKAIEARIQAHYDAGADHVCIQPFRADGEPGPDLRLLEALAPRPAAKAKPAARAASVRTRAKAKPKPAKKKATKRAPKRKPAKKRRR